jgi:hypothetical protein
MECYAGKPNCVIDGATSIVVDLSASSKYSPQRYVLEPPPPPPPPRFSSPHGGGAGETQNT